MKSADELIVELIKEIQLTVICTDDKEHIISLSDFRNMRDSELSSDYNKETGSCKV